MASNDYSQVLPDIAAPATADGSLAIQAGKTQGAAAQSGAAAKAFGIAAETGLASAIGGTAVDAAKGKLEANAQDEIQKVLKNTEPMVEADIKANNTKLAQGFLESAKSDDFAGINTVNQFTDEARKFAEARRQGLVSREEVATQIGAIIKKYSAQAPGMASDFRKIGAELTGISNVDAYGIHQYLTTKTAQEKLAEKQMEVDIQLTHDIAKDRGYSSINQVTTADKTNYMQRRQYAAIVSDMENQKKVGDIQQDRVDQFNERLVGVKIADAMASVTDRLSKLSALHQLSDGPVSAEKAMQFGGQVAGELGVMKSQLINDINALTVGPNPMSQAKAKTLAERVSKNLDDYSEFVKTQEGFNWWQQKVKASKGNAEYLVNSFMTEHPNVMLYKELGVMSDYVKAWDALDGNKDAFSKRFGAKAADAMERVQRNGIRGYTAAFGRVANGTSTIQTESDPDQKDMLYNDAINGLQGLMKQGGILSTRQKQVGANLSNNWLATFEPTRVSDLNKFSSIMNTDAAMEFYGKLDPMQRATALAPFFDKVKTTVPNTIHDVKDRVVELNNTDAWKQFGHSVEVRLDPLSQRFEVVEKEGLRPPFGSTPGGSAVATPYVPMRADSLVREQLDVLKKRVEWLNAAPRALEKMVPLVNKDLKPQVGAMLSEINQGLKGDRNVNLVSSLFSQAEAPRNPTTPADFPKENASERDQRSADAAFVLFESEGKDGVQKHLDLMKRLASRPNLKPGLKNNYESEIGALEAVLRQ